MLFLTPRNTIGVWDCINTAIATLLQSIICLSGLLDIKVTCNIVTISCSQKNKEVKDLTFFYLWEMAKQKVKNLFLMSSQGQESLFPKPVKSRAFLWSVQTHLNSLIKRAPFSEQYWFHVLIRTAQKDLYCLSSAVPLYSPVTYISLVCLDRMAVIESLYQSSTANPF